MSRARASRVQSGGTALHTAVFYGELDVVRALLNAGADKTIANNQGYNPMTMYDACAYKEHNKDAIFALLGRDTADERRAAEAAAAAAAMGGGMDIFGDGGGGGGDDY